MRGTARRARVRLRAGEKPAEQDACDGLPRPVWLLDAPLPLASGLILEQGPERIESGWWDENGIDRDYYVARNEAGERFWIFRERKEPQRWFVHGLFA